MHPPPRDDAPTGVPPPPITLTASEALQLREEQLRGILDSAGEAIVTVDDTQTIVMANTMAAKVFGHDVAALVGMPLGALLPERLRIGHRAAVAAWGRSDASAQPMGGRAGRADLVGLRANGEEFPFEAAISQAHAGGARLMTVILRDLSEERRTLQALRASQKLLAATFNVGGVGMAQIDPQTRRFVAVNAALCRLCGYSEDELRQMTVEQLVAPGDPSCLDAAAASEPRLDGERRLRRKDGQVVWVQASIGTMLDAGDQPTRLICVAQDVSARHDALQALGLREARLDFLVRLNDRLRLHTDPQAIGYEAACLLCAFADADRVGYAEDDGDGVHVTVARNATRGVPGIEGRHRYLDFGEAVMRGLHDGQTLVQPDIAADPALSAEVKAAHAALQAAATVNVPIVQRGRLVAVLFVHSCTPRHWDDHEVALFQDVAARVRADIERAHAEAALRATATRLKASEAELRRLIASQDKVQEQERLRIARELHDDMQQNLAAILMEAEVVRTQAAGLNGRVREAVSRIERLGTAVIASMRRVVHDLRPQALEDLGVVHALQTLARDFHQRSGIPCQVDTSDLGADQEAHLAPVATCVYRVVQEALNNVSRHAGARSVQVRLSSRDVPGLKLEVSDDGVGIRPEHFDKTESFGLLGMRERVRACGGTLNVRARRRGGTVVEALLPL